MRSEEDYEIMKEEEEIIVEKKEILEEISKRLRNRKIKIYYKMREEEKEEIDKIVIENYSNSYTYYDENKRVIRIETLRCLFYTVNIGDNMPNDRPIKFEKIRNWDYRLYTNLEETKFDTS